jgi:hypothetical protein
MTQTSFQIHFSALFLSAVGQGMGTWGRVQRERIRHPVAGFGGFCSIVVQRLGCPFSQTYGIYEFGCQRDKEFVVCCPTLTRGF